MQKTILLSTVTFLALSFAVAIAQDDSSTSPSSNEERFVIETKDKEARDKDKDNPVYKDLKLEREYKPRLPNNFAPLVDTAQKDKIYKILTEYNALIDMLELRVKLLKDERDAKVDAVLTPAQQQRLNRPIRTLLNR